MSQWEALIYTDKFDYLYVEPTSYCSLKCPKCARTTNPDRFKPTHLSPQTLQIFLQSQVWSQLKVIEYGGNLGDPIMHNDFGGLIRAVREVRPKASHLIHTSGANRNLDWWEKLIQDMTLNDSVTFSVDGLKDTNHIYRINADWQTIEDAMKFCVGKVHTHWKMIVFKHNEHQINEVVKRAKDIGVSWFLLTKSSRYDSGEDDMKPSPNWVSQVGNIKLEGVDPKCVKSSRHYISAEGKYFPCCWISIDQNPTIDCEINNDFKFEETVLEPMEKFAKNWSGRHHKVCAEMCGKSTGLSSRTQYDQIDLNLAQPLSVIEETIRQFSNSSC